MAPEFTEKQCVDTNFPNIEPTHCFQSAIGNKDVISKNLPNKQHINGRNPSIESTEEDITSAIQNCDNEHMEPDDR